MLERRSSFFGGVRLSIHMVSRVERNTREDVEHRVSVGGQPPPLSQKGSWGVSYFGMTMNLIFNLHFSIFNLIDPPTTFCGRLVFGLLGLLVFGHA